MDMMMPCDQVLFFPSPAGWETDIRGNRDGIGISVPPWLSRLVLYTEKMAL